MIYVSMFVLVYCWVRVFWSSGIVDRPSDRLYAYTITLFRRTDRCSRYNPFSYQAWLSIWKDSRRRQDLLENYPLTEAPTRDHQVPELFQTTELPGAFPTTEPLSSKKWESYNLGARSTWVTRFNITQAFKNETRSAKAYQIHLVTSIG